MLFNFRLSVPLNAVHAPSGKWSNIVHDELREQFDMIQKSRNEYRRIAAEATAAADDCDATLAALNGALIELEVLQPVTENHREWSGLLTSVDRDLAAEAHARDLVKLAHGVP